IMQFDDLDGAACSEAIELLRERAFLLPEPPLAASSSTLRAVLFEGMSAERVAELQRITAITMGEADTGDRFLSATRAFYLHETGHGREAARRLLQTAEHASHQGYARSALRLAATAVDYDPSDEVRAAAARVTQSVASRPSRAPASRPP